MELKNRHLDLRDQRDSVPWHVPSGTTGPTEHQCSKPEENIVSIFLCPVKMVCLSFYLSATFGHNVWNIQDRDFMHSELKGHGQSKVTKKSKCHLLT